MPRVVRWELRSQKAVCPESAGFDCELRADMGQELQATVSMNILNSGLIPRKSHAAC